MGHSRGTIPFAKEGWMRRPRRVLEDEGYLEDLAEIVSLGATGVWKGRRRPGPLARLAEEAQECGKHLGLGSIFLCTT